MEKATVIMSPTVNRAVYAWKEFQSKWPGIIKRTNKAKLYIELLDGHKIYFKAETEGENVLFGLRANITSLDEFVMPKESEEKE